MTSLELQSGFVVAVILAVLFLSDRFAPGVLMQRALQAGVALCLVLTVAAGTEAVVPSPNVKDIADDIEELQANLDQEPPDEQFFEVTEDMANDDDVRAMIQFAAGIVLIIAGVVLVGRFAVMPAGIVFGGLLVLLTSGSQGNGDVISQLLDFVIGDSASSAGYDIARFFVFLLGTLALLWTVYMRFEEQHPRAVTTPGPPPPDAPPATPPPARDPFER